MWARSLLGGLDPNGYLLLQALAPLNVGNQFDGLFGAPVSGANQVELASHLYCGQPGSDATTRRRFVNGDGSTSRFQPAFAFRAALGVGRRF